MDFIHQGYDSSRTIAAIATPPGEGAISIIRISGPNALSIANSIFSKDVTTFASHTAHHGQIKDKEGQVVDDVLLLVMLKMRSFTGEDTVEIHCHGGSFVTRKVLDVVLQAGAKPASPGEFTFRAFSSGKIDLAQAEAIQELIAAKNDLALKHAESHLEGRLSSKVLGFQKALVDIAAIFEAWVDYPEEGLEFASYDDILLALIQEHHALSELCKTFHEGKIISSKLSCCLLGAPNAGKSSLMNALCGKDRAIVTAVPGTTRDLLEEDVYFAGLHFKFIDTAGIRETEELIEKEGIKRSKACANKSDLILFLVDSSIGLTEEELKLLDTLPQDKTILVWNKIDLKAPPTVSYFPYFACVSAKELIGLDHLKATIHSLLLKEGLPSKEELIITNARHYEALLNAKLSLEKVIDGLKNGLSPEFLSFDLRQTLVELGTIIGTNITENILSSIFSKFCVGK